MQYFMHPISKRWVCFDYWSTWTQRTITHAWHASRNQRSRFTTCESLEGSLNKDASARTLIGSVKNKSKRQFGSSHRNHYAITPWQHWYHIPETNHFLDVKLIYCHHFLFSDNQDILAVWEKVIYYGFFQRRLKYTRHVAFWRIIRSKI